MNFALCIMHNASCINLCICVHLSAFVTIYPVNEMHFVHHSLFEPSPACYCASMNAWERLLHAFTMICACMHACIYMRKCNIHKQMICIITLWGVLF